MLNTAVESDSTFPELKQIMSLAFQEMTQFVSGIISDGKDSGEFSQETDPDSLVRGVILYHLCFLTYCHVNIKRSLIDYKSVLFKLHIRVCVYIS